MTRISVLKMGWIFSLFEKFLFNDQFIHFFFYIKEKYVFIMETLETVEEYMEEDRNRLLTN